MLIIPLVLALAPTSTAGLDPVQPMLPATQKGEQWTQEELERITRRIQGEVEVLRGAAFEREVRVAITDKEGFLKHATQRMDEMVGPEELSSEQDVVKLLGLIPPEMDLLQVSMDLLEDQVGGFYDPSEEAFYLMDTFTGAIAEIIISHELTHALDDQLFDIDGTLEPLLKERDATNAFQAVVEGSGTLVMGLWTIQHARGLDPEELMEASTMGTESLGEAPEYIWKPLLAAYMVGQKFLMYGQNLGDGPSRSAAEVIDQAFREPPRSTEQVLHPEKYWNEKRRDEPRELAIEVGELPEGWKVLDESTLGELNLALLAGDDAGIDFTNPMAAYSIRYTNKAATGWGGDRMVLLGSEKARFLHVKTLWDTERDAKQFHELLDERMERWTGDLQKLSSAEVGDGSSGVRVESWDGDSPGLRFMAWYGVDPEELSAVQGLVRFREVTEK